MNTEHFVSGFLKFTDLVERNSSGELFLTLPRDSDDHKSVKLFTDFLISVGCVRSVESKNDSDVVNKTVFIHREKTEEILQMIDALSRADVFDGLMKHVFFYCSRHRVDSYCKIATWLLAHGIIKSYHSTEKDGYGSAIIYFN